jgi:hypothetical protein
VNAPDRRHEEVQRENAALRKLLEGTRVVGRPSAESDAAISRFLERFLQREHPGAAWRVGERGEGGRLLEAAPGEVDIGPGRPDDQGEVAA